MKMKNNITVPHSPQFIRRRKNDKKEGGI